jgi:membrane-bound lytic murein transglycosylase B
MSMSMSMSMSIIGRMNIAVRHPLYGAACLGAVLASLISLATLQVAQAAPRKAAAAKSSAPAAPPYAARDDVLRFADDVAERRNLPRTWVATQLAQARRIDAVRRLVMPPPAGTAKNWAAYRARFVEPQRIDAGLAFWQSNERWLTQAQARWGVPAAVVVAIVGVETYYGRHTGNFRIIDALATLSFDFPTGRKDRSAFFRSELEAFLSWCAREGIDPQLQKGSFAGAMGLPQFMPSSIGKFAVDMDGDGHIDLQGSHADVVGSVARYLADSGWQRDMPTHYDVAVPVDASDRAVLLGPDILPSFSAAQFIERGAELSEAGRQHVGPLALVELQNGDRAPSYIAGTQNFYAVTRYNWSSYYALAVIELAQALANKRGVAP